MDTQSLRIMFVVDAIKGRNGVGAYFQDLATHLGEQVERVELVQPCLENPHPCQGGSMPIPGDPTQRLFFPKVRALSALVWEMKPHVIVIPGPGIFSMAGYWIAKKWGIPVCVTFQTDYNKLVELYWGKRLARLAGGLLHWVNRTLFQGSEMAATICDSMIDQARSAGARNPQLVGTPLAREFVNTPLQPAKEKIQRVCYVGRLAAEKNLSAFLDLARARPDLYFDIAGDGPLRAEVEAASRELSNLQCHGWCTRQQVVSLLDSSDVLILPSSVEAFGTVALEAMARQRLVITTPACGINEWPELADQLWTAKQNETMASALARLESLDSNERQQLATSSLVAALKMNDNAVLHWASLLRQCERLRSNTSQPSPSLTLALLRRLGRTDYV